MDADWSVELGADDPALEFPWTSSDGSQHYFDLVSNPDAVHDLEEVVQHSSLREFFTKLNSADSCWQTVKCDAWLDDELSGPEDIYIRRCRMGSYVDLIRRKVAERSSFEQHESWVKSAARRLSSAGDDAMVCEFVVRRCYYHCNGDPDADSEAGFYITVYVFGHGPDEATATARWGEGLTLVSSVLAE